MRHLLYLLLCSPIVFATPTPESLLKEASALYLTAKLPIGSVTESTLSRCLVNGAAAQEKINALFKSYPQDPISNSLDAKRLQGQIKGALAQCKRIQKDLNKKPYEPKNRENTVSF